MKVCTRCKIEKEDSDFSVATSRYKNRVYKFLKSNCRKCEAELASIRYNRLKNDETLKKKNRERVLRYAQANMDELKRRRKLPEYAKKHAELNNKSYHRVKDFVAAKMKIKRQTQEYKDKMKAYREKNKEKIHAQEAVTKRRYHEKNKNQISDEYVIAQLRTQGININEDNIETKKIKILITRLRKAISQTCFGKTKICIDCGEEKDINQFWRTEKNGDKRLGFCKTCGYVRKKKSKNRKNEKYNNPSQSSL